MVYLTRVLYIYIYIYIYTHTYIHIYHIYTYIYIYIHIYIYIYISFMRIIVSYIHIYYIYTYIYIHIYIYIVYENHYFLLTYPQRISLINTTTLKTLSITTYLNPVNFLFVPNIKFNGE